MKFTTAFGFLKALVENNGVLWTAKSIRFDIKTNNLFNMDELLCQFWFTTEPLKDKDLVECWNEDSTHARTYRFWDAKNNKPFSRKGLRSGITWQNYRKITPLPEWAIEAQKTLED